MGWDSEIRNASQERVIGEFLLIGIEEVQFIGEIPNEMEGLISVLNHRESIIFVAGVERTMRNEVLAHNLVSPLMSRLSSYIALFAEKTGVFRVDAGLSQDMAKRIMYSVLPSLADANQIALTEGVVDYKALKAAVHGRKDIIRFGCNAVLQEMDHFRSSAEKDMTTSLKAKVQRLLYAKQYEEAMDAAIEAFSNEKAWVGGFGGRAWEQIARTLRQLVRLDKGLAAVQSSPNKDPKQEVQLMKDIVVEMNVFDGLAHNSDSIMNYLVESETGEQGRDNQHYHDEFLKIKRLMDAKELDNPIEVFKQIEPTLQESGDINQYKDWLGKIRRRDDFRTDDPKRAQKLFLIYVRKALIHPRRTMNSLIDDLSASLLRMEGDYDASRLISWLEKCDAASYEIDIAIQGLERMVLTFVKQYPEYASLEKVFLDLVSSYAGKARAAIYIPLKQKRDMLAREADRAPNKWSPEQWTSQCKECLSLVKHFSFLLDEI